MRRIVTLSTACALLLAACGTDDSTRPAGGGQPDDSRERATATVAVASSSLGDILVDSEGMTLYMFMPDQEENGRPTCYDQAPRRGPHSRPQES
jgi:predicted lipoprotein with Yx(FWY)xxD motif